MAATPAPMSANQTAYLTGLVKAGGGNAEWAKSQLGAVPQINKTPETGFGISSTPQVANPTPMPKADPATAASYQAAANQFTANNWGPNGTANGLTESQNIANVYNQQGNTAALTPYISGALSQASKDSQQVATPKPQGTFNPAGSAGDNPAPASVPVAASNPTPAPQSQSSFPGQLSNSQIQAEAAARIAKTLAAAQTAATGALTGAKNTFDYTNKITGDDRTLRNSQFQENNNPFSGKFAYDKTNMLRNDNIQDTSTNNNYNAQVAQINQKLQDIQTAAPGDQQAMIDQLTKAERDYGIQLGALTGQINGQNTMQQNQNNFNNGIAQAGLTGQIPQGMGGGQTQQAQAQSFNQNMQTNQFNQQAQNQGFNQNMQTQQFAYTQARDAIKDKQYQQTFDQNVQQQGLDYALKQATLANQITNDQAQRSIGYMNAQTSQQNANTSSSNSSWAKDPNNPDNLYKQSQIDKNNSAKPKSTDYKTDPNFASDVAHLKASPADAAKLDTNPQQFIDAYGYDGYLALRKEAGL